MLVVVHHRLGQFHQIGIARFNLKPDRVSSLIKSRQVILVEVDIAAGDIRYFL